MHMLLLLQLCRSYSRLSACRDCGQYEQSFLQQTATAAMSESGLESKSKLKQERKEKRTKKFLPIFGSDLKSSKAIKGLISACKQHTSQQLVNIKPACSSAKGCTCMLCLRHCCRARACCRASLLGPNTAVLSSSLADQTAVVNSCILRVLNMSYVGCRAVPTAAVLQG